MEECFIDDKYRVEKQDERKPRHDQTEVYRGMIGTEKVTITQTYEDGRVEKMHREAYPNEKDVGRTVTDETRDKTPQDDHRRVTDRSLKKEATTTRKDRTGIHRTDVKDVERKYVTEKQEKHFGPKRPEEQFLKETERLDYQRKVSSTIVGQLPV